MLLNFLKQGTEDIHKITEDKNLAKYILDHSISIEDYNTLLTINYNAYTTIEQALVQKKSKFDEILHPFIDTGKSERLLHDIKKMDSNKHNNLISNPNSSKYTIHSQFEAIGALYVIEGSMLGGLLINKHLSKCTQLKEVNAFSFFSHDPKATLNRWKTFCSTINQMNFDHTEKETALVSAKKTFSIFNEYSKLSVLPSSQ